MTHPNAVAFADDNSIQPGELNPTYSVQLVSTRAKEKLYPNTEDHVHKF